MSIVIERIKALEVLDSRGNPTVEAKIFLSNGKCGSAIVPSGASTGEKEAVELRDKNKQRFNGKGVLKAVSNVENEIAEELIGLSPFNQRKIDKILNDTDGTSDKHKIGANATLAVSLAVARAASKSLGINLSRYIGGCNANIMPVPMMNIINGGKHASNGLAIQEFMIMPISTPTFAEALRAGSEVFYSLKRVLQDNNHSTNVGDEGGFAPNLKSSTEALEMIAKAISLAGYKLGEDFILALDCASSEFHSKGIYKIDGKELDSDRLIEYYQELCNNFPIYSIEDPLSENDHEGFKKITKLLGNKIQIVGDDLFCTNPKIIQAGIDDNLANAVLIKPNQIGTLSETLDAIELAKRNSYNCIISHRSGESEDTTIAHIAVGTNAGQIKTGSLSRSDRIAKYNELLRLEDELDGSATYFGYELAKHFKII